MKNVEPRWQIQKRVRRELRNPPQVRRSQQDAGYSTFWTVPNHPTSMPPKEKSQQRAETRCCTPTEPTLFCPCGVRGQVLPCCALARPLSWRVPAAESWRLLRGADTCSAKCGVPIGTPASGAAAWLLTADVAKISGRRSVSCTCSTLRASVACWTYVQGKCSLMCCTDAVWLAAFDSFLAALTESRIFLLLCTSPPSTLSQRLWHLHSESSEGRFAHLVQLEPRFLFVMFVSQ